MSRAIDDLRHEHEAILAALRILERFEQRAAAGQPLDTADLASFLGFLQEFADKCHHGKEEGILFPALVGAGLPAQGGPVGALLDEHAQGRDWIARMAASLAPALDPARFAEAARGYRELLQAHIRKENEELFPMAEEMLGPDTMDRLFERFEAHEAQVIGEGRHEQLHALLKGLWAKYLAAA
ncbi:hemerythrin domain-containing protein [Ramlibacter sp. MAHUQ-53]|uniref:hemerythrin domain-containing protein n=1 Tax=unclassified Ramlibacter TaxID=2617605 RepID=UPI00364000BB